MFKLLLCLLYSGTLFAASKDTDSYSADVTNNAIKTEEIQVAKRSGKHRIVGGDYADKGEYPWLIVLLPSRYFLCGGTIIDESTIITAAHCLKGFKKTTVRVIAGDYKFWKKERSEQIMRVKKIIMHPKYKVNTQFDSDIAILKLSKKLRFNKFVQPIGLVKDFKMEKRLLSKSNCVAVGVGAEDNLSTIPVKTKDVKVNVLSRAKCSEIFSVAFTENMVCSSRRDNAVCTGDSGGPLLCYDDTEAVKSKAYLIGVVSFGSKDCFEGHNSYARVAKFVKWIKNKS